MELFFRLHRRRTARDRAAVVVLALKLHVDVRFLPKR